MEGVGSAREQLEGAVRSYYAACNRGDFDAIAACFAAEAVHYFPRGAPQGPFMGARAIAQGWVDAVARLDSRWTIDHLVIDETKLQVVIEWTHWKPAKNGHLRGSETCTFDSEGRITEIRAYYAAPSTDSSHELGEFPYEARGFALEPPQVDRRGAGSR